MYVVICFSTIFKVMNYRINVAQSRNLKHSKGACSATKQCALLPRRNRTLQRNNTLGAVSVTVNAACFKNFSIAVSVDAKPSRDSKPQPYLHIKLAQIILIFSYFHQIPPIFTCIKWEEIDLHVSADVTLRLD